jgi:hypothetical protein
LHTWTVPTISRTPGAVVLNGGPPAVFCAPAAGALDGHSHHASPANTSLPAPTIAALAPSARPSRARGLVGGEGIEHPAVEVEVAVPPGERLALGLLDPGVGGGQRGRVDVAPPDAERLTVSFCAGVSRPLPLTAMVSRS